MTVANAYGTADTFLNSSYTGQPWVCFGHESFVDCGYGNKTVQYNALLRTDLGLYLPVGATISAASLKLYVSNVYGTPGNYRGDRLTTCPSNWTEEGATENGAQWDFAKCDNFPGGAEVTINVGAGTLTDTRNPFVAGAYAGKRCQYGGAGQYLDVASNTTSVLTGTWTSVGYGNNLHYFIPMVNWNSGGAMGGGDSTTPTFTFSVAGAGYPKWVSIDVTAFTQDAWASRAGIWSTLLQSTDSPPAEGSSDYFLFDARVGGAYPWYIEVTYTGGVTTPPKTAWVF